MRTGDTPGSAAIRSISDADEVAGKTAASPPTTPLIRRPSRCADRARDEVVALGAQRRPRVDGLRELVPGVLQFRDALVNGYAHARAAEFFARTDVRILECYGYPETSS